MKLEKIIKEITIDKRIKNINQLKEGGKYEIYWEDLGAWAKCTLTEKDPDYNIFKFSNGEDVTFWNTKYNEIYSIQNYIDKGHIKYI